jgi:hypothetical protein
MIFWATCIFQIEFPYAICVFGVEKPSQNFMADSNLLFQIFSITSCVYIVLQLFQISCQDPAYHILVHHSDRQVYIIHSNMVFWLTEWLSLCSVLTFLIRILYKQINILSYLIVYLETAMIIDGRAENKYKGLSDEAT